MNTFSTPFGLPDTAPALARRFAMIMAGLGALIARRFVKMPHLTGFTLLLWGRLNRSVQRFYRALTIPAKARAPQARVERTRQMRLRLPSGRGWIVRELGWEAAAYLLQLEALLAEMATQTALAKAPGAARIVRPICRMLGVSAALLPKNVAKVVVPMAGQEPALVAGETLIGMEAIAPAPGRLFSGG